MTDGWLIYWTQSTGCMFKLSLLPIIYKIDQVHQAMHTYWYAVNMSTAATEITSFSNLSINNTVVKEHV